MLELQARWLHFSTASEEDLARWVEPIAEASGDFFYSETLQAGLAFALGEETRMFATLSAPQVYLWFPTRCCDALVPPLEPSWIPREPRNACSGCKRPLSYHHSLYWRPPFSREYRLPQQLDPWLSEHLDPLTAALVLPQLTERLNRIFTAKVLVKDYPRLPPPAFLRLLRSVEGPL